VLDLANYPKEATGADCPHPTAIGFLCPCVSAQAGYVVPHRSQLAEYNVAPFYDRPLQPPLKLWSGKHSYKVDRRRVRANLTVCPAP